MDFDYNSIEVCSFGVQLTLFQLLRSLVCLTLDFEHITQHLADPRHVYLGSRYVAVLFTTHLQHTL